MMTVVSPRTLVPLGLLIGTLLTSHGWSQQLAMADPDMGFQVAVVPADEAISPVKKQKLITNLQQAAEDYRSAQFERAVEWYQGASQLAPDRGDIVQSLENARRMLDMQRRALGELPVNPKERAKFLKTSFDRATQYYRAGQFAAARDASHKIWLTVGDFNDKVLELYRNSDERMVASGTPPTALTVPPAPALPSELDKAAEEAAPAPSGESLDQQVVAAWAAMQTGYFDDARTMLDDVLLKEPLHEGARLAMSRLELMERRQSAQAARQVAQAAEEAPAVDASGDLIIAKSNRLTREASDLAAEGKIPEALQRLEEALGLWPENTMARQLRDDLSGTATALAGSDGSETTDTLPLDIDVVTTGTEGPAVEEIPIPPSAPTDAVPAPVAAETEPIAEPIAGGKSDSRLAKEMFDDAQAKYNAGRLKEARNLWQQIVNQFPGTPSAATSIAYLEQTESEYQALVETEGLESEAKSMEDRGRELLNAPISVTTDRKVPLEEFITLLSFATPTELQYYIAPGAEAEIFANFVDAPLREILDTVLKPAGLDWSINEKNVITIKTAIFIRTFQLTPEQVSKIRELLDGGHLQRNIWGQVEPPAKGVELTLDERQNVLLAAGSRLHIDKLENFLPTIQYSVTPDLVTKFYKIREKDGPKIRSLIESLIRTDETSVFELERKVLVDGNDLIIKDTPDNLRKIEELLLDQKFIQGLTEEKLAIANFSLIPKDVENVQTDQIQNFTARVVEAIKVFLYAQEGENKARADGRQIWFDEATLQVTLVDTPTNIGRVREYIESLPELGERQQFRVINLKFQPASTLKPNLEEFLGLVTAGSLTGGGGGREQRIRLRRGDERIIFDNIRVRVLRVEENDEADRNDDTVELSVSIPGLGPQTTSLTELEPVLVQDFEFTAEDVLPSGGLPGEGTARILVRQIRTGLEPQGLATTPDAQALLQEAALAEAEEAGIVIQAFDDLNVLVIRYTDPNLFARALDLIEQLDLPTKQVGIETKFVQVNETRAKEFSADFNIAGLGKGREIDWDTQLINSRFAQDLDEFGNAFGPPIETPTSANLIKGTTVIDAVIGSFPRLEYSLRFLEAEGIINIVNGPRVLTLNGEEATFRIERVAPTAASEQTENPTVDIIPAFQDAGGGGLQLSEQDEATPGGQGGGNTGNISLLDAVVLRVTPQITSDESILLRDLNAELIDFEGFIGSVVTPIVQPVAEEGTGGVMTPIVPGPAITNMTGAMLQRRKRIETNARIANGGTIVIGGWTGERTTEFTSGVPVLRNLPYFGKLLFSRNQRTRDRTTLLIFLTGSLVD